MPHDLRTSVPTTGRPEDSQIDQPGDDTMPMANVKSADRPRFAHIPHEVDWEALYTMRRLAHPRGNHKLKEEIRAAFVPPCFSKRRHAACIRWVTYGASSCDRPS